MTVDSNILIDYLNGDRRIRQFLSDLKLVRRPLFVSTVSMAELLSFSTLTERDIVAAEDFVSEHFFVVSFDGLLAREAGRLRRQYRLKLPDAIIAATALRSGTPLITRDTDFERIDGLELLIP